MASEMNPEDVPALPPPPGQTSNFDNPPDLHAWTLGVGITSMVIMTVGVFVRTYTKAVIIREMPHEDYIAIIALIGFLAWGAIYIHLSALGLSRDQWNIRAVDMSYFLYMSNIFQLVYPPAMGFAKYFICIQLKRIFGPRQLHRTLVWWALQGLIVATIIYYVACFFTFLFQCVPRKKIWNPMVEGHCIDNKAGVLSAGLINLILDLGILLVPIWAIWHLQMPLKRKLGATAIFAVGIFTCTIAALGVAYRVPLLNDTNQTKAIGRVGLWTFAELAGTMFVGCMPMFPRFYEHSNLVRVPIATLQSFQSLLGSWGQSRRSTRASNATNDLQPPKISSSTQSREAIVVTKHFTREDVPRDAEYIELGDATRKTPWEPSGAV